MIVLVINHYVSFNYCFNFLLPLLVTTSHKIRGTANCALYDGRVFAPKGNVILVTINYRLGALGYLVDSKRGLKGNFALKDQRLALQWVQKYVRYFGGNPNRVTIFGESAGAGSVTALLLNRASWGLYSKAILQSNPLSLPFRDVSSSDSLGQRFVEEAKCSHDSTLNCIRNLPMDQVVKCGDDASNHLNIFHPIIAFMPWTPTIDGVELFQQPLEAFRDGNYYKIPIMMGSLSEEAIMFVYLALTSPINSIEYDAAVAGLFTTSYFDVHKYYPATDSSDQRPEFSKLGTDYIFTAPTRNALMNIHLQQQDTPVYLFFFNHTLSFSDKAFNPRYPFCVGHCCHGSELPILFGSSTLLNLPLSKEEQVLSDAMVNYWTNFAYTGNPNKAGDGRSTSGLVKWEPFSSSNLVNMQFETPRVFMNQNLKKTVLDMFDYVGYHHGW